MHSRIPAFFNITKSCSKSKLPTLISFQSQPLNAHKFSTKAIPTIIPHHNNKRNLIVQKFGGTSLGKPEKLEKVLNIITATSEQSNVISVVSALSSEIKAEGTTSLLLAAADCAVHQRDFQSLLEQIEQTHLQIIESVITNSEIRASTTAFLREELRKLQAFCSSLSVIEELSPRSHDTVIGCGERLSAGLTSAALQDRGYRGLYVDLSSVFARLDATRPGYQRLAKQQLQARLNAALGEPWDRRTVPVVTGFFGHVHGGIINGVGRGYSDLTAALCAGAMNARALQVWKESDGVFTGDPTKIPDAQLLARVTCQEAVELTYFGNQVLHPFTMKCAVEDRVPIHILNTFKPDAHGTVILPDDELVEQEQKQTRNSGSGSGSAEGIIAVCSKRGINVINLSMIEHDSMISVYNLFHTYRIKADLISTSMSNISVAIHEAVPMISIRELVEELKDYGTVTWKTDRAIVSCIGAGMWHQVGIASKVFGCLSQQGINIEMISQGSSEINMSVVIQAHQTDKAILAIHDTFLQDMGADADQEIKLKSL